MKKLLLSSLAVLSLALTVESCKDLTDAIDENPLTANSMDATINSAPFSVTGSAFKRDEGSNIVSVNAVAKTNDDNSKSLQLTMTTPTATGTAQNGRMFYVVRTNGVEKLYTHVSGTITLTEITPKFKGTFFGQVQNGSETLTIEDGEFNVNN